MTASGLMVFVPNVCKCCKDWTPCCSTNEIWNIPLITCIFLFFLCWYLFWFCQLRPLVCHLSSLHCPLWFCSGTNKLHWHVSCLALPLVSSWCSCTVPAREGGSTVVCVASSSPSWSVCVRQRRRLLLWRNQRWWRPIWGTWSSCLRWSGPWLECTMEKPSTRWKSRYGGGNQKAHFCISYDLIPLKNACFSHLRAVVIPHGAHFPPKFPTGCWLTK